MNVSLKVDGGKYDIEDVEPSNWFKNRLLLIQR